MTTSHERHDWLRRHEGDRAHLRHSETCSDTVSHSPSFCVCNMIEPRCMQTLLELGVEGRFGHQRSTFLVTEFQEKKLLGGGGW